MFQDREFVKRENGIVYYYLTGDQLSRFRYKDLTPKTPNTNINNKKHYDWGFSNIITIPEFDPDIYGGEETNIKSNIETAEAMYCSKDFQTVVVRHESGLLAIACFNNCTQRILGLYRNDPKPSQPIEALEKLDKNINIYHYVLSKGQNPIFKTKDCTEKSTLSNINGIINQEKDSIKIPLTINKKEYNYVNTTISALVACLPNLKNFIIVDTDYDDSIGFAVCDGEVLGLDENNAEYIGIDLGNKPFQTIAREALFKSMGLEIQKNKIEEQEELEKETANRFDKKIIKQADAMQILILQNVLKLEDVEKLVNHNLDAEVIKCWEFKYNKQITLKSKLNSAMKYPSHRSEEDKKWIAKTIHEIIASNELPKEEPPKDTTARDALIGISVAGAVVGLCKYFSKTDKKPKRKIKTRKPAEKLIDEDTTTANTELKHEV